MAEAAVEETILIPMPNLPTPTDYHQLHQHILQLITEGKDRARAAVEREKIQTYWEIGRVLHTHFLQHKDRAEYGQQVIVQLTQDLGMGKRLLYHMINFYRAFPIVHARAQLTWSHYRKLSEVPNKTVRSSYEQVAAEQRWSTRELADAIKSKAISPAQQATITTPPDHPPQLAPGRGRLYMYRVLPPSDEVEMRIDLGFKMTYTPTRAEAQSIGMATMVNASVGQRTGYTFKAVEDVPSRLYTFCARVEEVIDGDTIRVWIDYGFRLGGYQKLRVRGIDTPEMSTRAGVHAREAVVDWLSGIRDIVLSTSRVDKYGRYVADVFYLPHGATPEAMLQDGVYLNQRLLHEGLAKVYEG